MLTPAYLNGASEGSLRVFGGSGSRLSLFEALERGHRARIAGRRIFTLKRRRDGWALKARVDGLRLAPLQGAAVELARKQTRLVVEPELRTLTVSWQTHWWRFSAVAERPLVSIPEAGPGEAELETRWFVWLTKRLLVGTALALGVLQLLPIREEAPELAPPTVVSLKHVKLLEHPAPPKPVAVVQQQAPPKSVSKTVPKPVDRARAQRRALSRSLDFLSLTPKRVALADKPSRPRALAVPVAPAAGRALTRLTPASDGPIQTEGARSETTKAGWVGSGRGKALNEVQGTVSLHAFAGPAGDAGLAPDGIAVTGEGVAQSEIERALAGHLRRFQYCYEKALLTDSKLAGQVVVQWRIGPDGAANGVRVLRSQLNHAALHACLAAEIAKVRFPASGAGAVEVKYPFSFSSTAL
jgi:outer membrane biosynthesis protein TonB